MMDRAERIVAEIKWLFRDLKKIIWTRKNQILIKNPHVSWCQDEISHKLKNITNCPKNENNPSIKVMTSSSIIALTTNKNIITQRGNESHSGMGRKIG